MYISSPVSSSLIHPLGRPFYYPLSSYTSRTRVPLPYPLDPRTRTGVESPTDDLLGPGYGRERPGEREVEILLSQLDLLKIPGRLEFILRYYLLFPSVPHKTRTIISCLLQTSQDFWWFFLRDKHRWISNGDWVEWDTPWLSPKTGRRQKGSLEKDDVRLDGGVCHEGQP